MEALNEAADVVAGFTKAEWRSKANLTDNVKREIAVGSC